MIVCFDFILNGKYFVSFLRKRIGKLQTIHIQSNEVK